MMGLIARPLLAERCYTLEVRRLIFGSLVDAVVLWSAGAERELADHTLMMPHVGAAPDFGAG